MLKKTSTFKLLFSAVAGFLVGAVLVVFPGPGLGHLKWDGGNGQGVEACRIYHDNLEANFHLSEQEKRLAQESFQKTAGLCILQNELDCLPFLMLCSFLGPVILLVGWRSSVSKMDQVA